MKNRQKREEITLFGLKKKHPKSVKSHPIGTFPNTLCRMYPFPVPPLFQLMLVSLFSLSSLFQDFLQSFILQSQEYLSFRSHLLPTFIFGFGSVLLWCFFFFTVSILLSWCVLGCHRSSAFYDFFVLNLGARCVFFDCVQKFFIKMKIMWSNFKLTRDAPEALAVRARRKVQKKSKKLPKTEKITFF